MKKQRGFTLLEMILALSIAGGILVIIIGTYFQVWAGREDIAQKSVAFTDLDNAIHWLSRDLVLAQTTDLVNGEPPATNVTMAWEDRTHWAGDTGNVTHAASYSWSGTNLVRTYDGQATLVARFLTNFSIYIDGKIFTVTLTSRPGFPQSAVTRTFSLEERSDLAPQ